MRRRRTSPIISTIVFLVPVLLIAAALWWFFDEMQPMNAADKGTVTITVPPKSGVRAIADQLSDTGLIRNRYTFIAAVALSGLGKDLKAGTFSLSPSMSATVIARELAKRNAAEEIVLTIPEGWTTAQIAAYLEQKGIGTKEDFISAAGVNDSRVILPDERFDFFAGRPPAATLEGYLFPDTYRVFPDATPADVIKKLLDNFGTKVTPEIRERIQAKGMTIYSVVTLASIVEREVRKDEDRAMVADIFLRRLTIGMPLESDATVNYVTGKSALQPTLTDTEIESPYNTYRNKGLPPGPINNPGLSSITAVINPQPNSYLYFLTDSAGGVHFGTTYEQHLANKQQYLQ